MSGRLLWCNPAFGVAGDMWMAALLDAGADEDRSVTPAPSVGRAGDEDLPLGARRSAPRPSSEAPVALRVPCALPPRTASPLSRRAVSAPQLESLPSHAQLAAIPLTARAPLPATPYL